MWEQFWPILAVTLDVTRNRHVCATFGAQLQNRHFRRTNGLTHLVVDFACDSFMQMNKAPSQMNAWKKRWNWKYGVLLLSVISKNKRWNFNNSLALTIYICWKMKKKHQINKRSSFNLYVKELVKLPTLIESIVWVKFNFEYCAKTLPVMFFAIHKNDTMMIHFTS